MTDNEAISIQMLRRATEATARAPQFEEKITWWLQGAHAAERWFQFEWAFQLQQALKSRYMVVCEKNWVDVVCIRPPFKLPFDIEAGLEIKFFGNWWVDEGLLDKAADDIQKVAKYPFPAAALIFLLVVKPVASALKWVKEQIDKGKGVNNEYDFVQRLVQRARQPPHEKLYVPLRPSVQLSNGLLLVAVYYNSACRPVPAEAET